MQYHLPSTESLLADSLARINAQVEAMGQQWQELKRSIDRSMAVQYAEVGRIFREQNLALEALVPQATALGRIGWTLPMDYPLAEISALLRNVERTSTKECDEAFDYYYTTKRNEHAKALFRALDRDERLSTWWPLLEECGASFLSRRYRVVVPALFLVLEGTIAAAGASLHKKVDPKALTATRRKAAEPGLARLVWASVEGFATEAFQNVAFSVDRPRTTNRHWVLHGRDRPDWSRVDALRLFQAVQTAACCM